MSKVITNWWRVPEILLICVTSTRAQGVLRTAYPPLTRTSTTTDVLRTNGTFTGYSLTNGTTTEYPPTNGTTSKYPPIRTNGTTTKSPIIDFTTVSTLDKYVYYEHSDDSTKKPDFAWAEFAAGHISALAIFSFVKLIWCVCKCSQKSSRYRFRKSSYLTDFLPPGYDYFCSQAIESMEVSKLGGPNCGNKLDGKTNEDVTFPQNFANKF